jgi:hypothetical protein
MVYRKGYRTTEPFVTVCTSHLYFDLPVTVPMSQLTRHVRSPTAPHAKATSTEIESEHIFESTSPTIENSFPK